MRQVRHPETHFPLEGGFVRRTTLLGIGCLTLSQVSQFEDDLDVLDHEDEQMDEDEELLGTLGFCNPKEQEIQDMTNDNEMIPLAEAKLSGPAPDVIPFKRYRRDE